MKASFLALAGIVALVACSDPVSSGNGHVEARIQDLPGGTITVPGATLQGNLFASISPGGSEWVDLGSPNGITVALQAIGVSTSVHGEQQAPADNYTRVRLVLSGVTVTLQSGSIIGGVTLTSNTTLQLGGADGQVEVSILVPGFLVSSTDAEKTLILFDLRSHFWLTAAAVQAGQVEDAALQGAIIATTEEAAR
jgi:hypothetical protein